MRELDARFRGHERKREGTLQVGFIGLGAMGALIVPRLMAAGRSVTGWNRSRDKAAPLIDAGMAWADSPRAVAENSEIVFSIVTDGAAVRAIALGDDGVLAGLKDRLMAPELVEAFIAAFNAELRQAAQAAEGERAGAQRMLAEIERKIAGILRAIEDGAPLVHARGNLLSGERIFRVHRDAPRGGDLR